MYFENPTYNYIFVIDKMSLFELDGKTMRKLFVLNALLLCFQLTYAQMIRWPGDANNNGIVNHFDLLYVGRAFGQTGPIDTFNGSFVPDTLPFWTQLFPGILPKWSYRSIGEYGLCRLQR